MATEPLRFLYKHAMPQAERLWQLIRTSPEEGGADLADGDPGESDAGVAILRPHVLGVARAMLAGAAVDAGRVLRLVGAHVERVEPPHVERAIVPQREGQHHAALQGCSHLRHAAVVREVVGVLELGLLLPAEGISDCVATDARDRGVRVLDDTAVLDIEALNPGQLARVGAICGVELRDNLDRPAGVHNVSRAVAVEGPVPHPVGVEVATILVAVPVETFFAIPARRAFTLHGARDAAGVRGVGCRLAVGLPDVHLGTAEAVLANSVVDVSRLGNVGLALNPLHVGALSVAVARAVLGTRPVIAFPLSAEAVHLDEVHRAVHAAAQLLHRDLHRELAVQQVEHLVLIGLFHHVDPRADVSAGRGEVEVQGVGTVDSFHSIGPLVVMQVEALHLAGCGANRGVGAELLAPALFVETVLVLWPVDPAPACVQHNLKFPLLATAGFGALVEVELRVGFLRDGAWLLCCHGAQQGQSEAAPGKHHWRRPATGARRAVSK
eukprot:CAMPEP_0175424174 /NCGR_PEP_ID=MMETSP0095-20121207/48643_1 /TAXON_ID=311494 /ORGANISM="Alexandrium monilatum, Strain CCMP3105" /LENGTH=495 /DNA_ID=CAMNT_0016723457 /DNA_START=9 /DNA_END=1493 /DNA_ORIENTATION=-